jgi:hypothetical protein
LWSGIERCDYPEDQEEVIRESSSAILYEAVSAWHLERVVAWRE